MPANFSSCFSCRSDIGTVIDKMRPLMLDEQAFRNSQSCIIKSRSRASFARPTCLAHGAGQGAG